MDIPAKPDTSEVAKWLRQIVTGEEQQIRKPLSEIEKWLAYIAENGAGGGAKAIVGWNGADEPDVTKIPEGVEVTWQGTVYEGTLEASKETTKYIVLVYNGSDGKNIFDEYQTVLDGDNYIWEEYGQKIDLSDYYTKAEIEEKLSEIDTKYADVAYISPLEKQILTVPVPEGEVEYTGQTVSPEWYAYNPDLMTIGGQTSGSAKGTYTATFTLNDTTNYCWADGSTEVKSVQWKIYKSVHTYGVSWAGTSSTALTRTDDSALFSDPVPYVAGATSYGSPFDNLMPWSGMQIVEDAQAGTLVSIPKFWYKLTQNGTGVNIQIADGPVDGFHVSPAHMDRGDGYGERDIVYVGRYHCASDYKSKTGVTPKGGISRSSARSSIHNLGATIWQSDFAMRFTLWLLYIVEFADWNSQTKIGYGCGNGYSAQSMGYTDSMPYHTGTTQSSRTTYGLGTQYRYVEGLWDNSVDWCDGCYNNSNGLNIILKPSSFSDSSGGTNIGSITSGFPSQVSVKDVSGIFPVFVPSRSSGGNTTYIPDYWSFSNDKPCLYVGGYSYKELNSGLFRVGSDGVSPSIAYSGCRLMKLPNN